MMQWLIGSSAISKGRCVVFRVTISWCDELDVALLLLCRIGHGNTGWQQSGPGLASCFEQNTMQTSRRKETE